MSSSYQDEVPQTPMALVSAEGLTSLHNLIKQDVYTLNKASIQRIERHVQKLAHAAYVSFADTLVTVAGLWCCLWVPIIDRVTYMNKALLIRL
jgi:hypothetical protein